MAKYLYNGTELPALPEHILAEHPYVTITREVSSGVYELCAFDSPGVVEDINSLGGTTYLSTALCYYDNGVSYINTGESWGDRIEHSKEDLLIEGSITWDITLSVDAGGKPNVVVWSNYDIYDENGSLYLAAGDDPVPVGGNSEKSFDLKNWLTGFILGLTGKPLPVSTEKKEPVTYYLYNGVRLPALPESLIGEPYYAFLRRNSDGTYRLLYCTEQLVEDGDDIYVSAEGRYCSWGCADGEWYVATESGSVTSQNKFLSRDNGTIFIWTSHDIKDKQDNFIYPKSELVPVDAIPSKGMCLYNNTELPPPPKSLIGEPYYAILRRNADGGYRLFYSSVPMVKKDNTVKVSAEGRYCSWGCADGEWYVVTENVSIASQTTFINYANGTSLIWTSHDILNELKEVIYAGSEPVYAAEYSSVHAAGPVGWIMGRGQKPVLDEKRRIIDNA